MKLVNRLTIRLGIWLLPKARVIPIEPYLEHHFTKLRAQSFQHLDDLLEQGGKYELEVGSLNELRTALADGDTTAKKSGLAL